MQLQYAIQMVANGAIAGLYPAMETILVIHGYVIVMIQVPTGEWER